jgi:hypothetical protein
MFRKVLRLILAASLVTLASSLGASGPFSPPFGSSVPSDEPTITIVGSYPSLLILVGGSSSIR